MNLPRQHTARQREGCVEVCFSRTLPQAAPPVACPRPHLLPPQACTPASRAVHEVSDVVERRRWRLSKGEAESQQHQSAVSEMTASIPPLGGVYTALCLAETQRPAIRLPVEGGRCRVLLMIYRCGLWAVWTDAGQLGRQAGAAHGQLVAAGAIVRPRLRRLQHHGWRGEPGARWVCTVYCVRCSSRRGCVSVPNRGQLPVTHTGGVHCREATSYAHDYAPSDHAPSTFAALDS